MPQTVAPVTRAIIILNVLVYLSQQVYGGALENLFALWPVSTPQFEPWQLLTYAFLHYGDLWRLQIAHISLNMFALFLCGPELEPRWGSLRFALYYLVCVLSAGATELWVESLTNTANDMMGASGGVFGLLLAFGWYLLREPMGIALLPRIQIPAWAFATVVAGMELYFALLRTSPDQAHLAHLGGMIGGALAIFYWRIRGTVT
jgi:membrane associated rhomboid family serine protease